MRWEQKSPGADAPGPWGERGGLDLADQVERRLQRFGAFGPLGGADFARMGSHVLGSLHAAQQFSSVAADAVVVHFDGLDLAFGVDHEGAAVSETCVFTFFDENLECTGQLLARVTD